MTRSGDEALQSSIALVGMAGRFPGAGDVESFWHNLVAGVESISFFSEEELRQAGVPGQVRRRPEYVPAKGVLEGLELFDAGFFGYSPREASHLDPQQRLLLECAWEALEDAGLRPERLPEWVGVYVGAGDTSYRFHLLRGHGDPLSGSKEVAGFFGNYPDFLATRVAYKLNLRGPALGIHTACSTSLVAINLACSALRGFECDMALAGGVSLRLPARSGYLYEEGGVASRDGHCRPFDARAAGTVTGDGVGVVVLKRLEDALRDGDPIHAVIRGWALNNDGAARAGFTAPSVEGQSEVIALAQAAAGVSARDISYVEAHGTGTPLGDPIEVAALTRAFRAHTADSAFCALGAVKSNIGHLDAAAGVAGVIKTAQALRHRLIPPTLHFERPNPALHLEQSPFFVPTQPLPWESPRGPRLAGVSSFGIGGTNAHTLLEEAPPPPASGPARPHQVLLLSARSASALERMAGRLAQHLRRHPHLELADVAFTLQVGRARFPYRRALSCRTLAEAVERLEAPAPRPPEPLAHEGERPPLVLLFPGQGTPLVGTARGLHESEPAFRQAVEQCARLLRPALGLDVREVLFPSAEQEEQARELAAQTRVAQPALFTLEYALAQVWLGWGLQPQALVGHSLGELVAACLAGVFSLEDALQLVAARGQLMQGCPPGAMLAVPLPEAELAALLGSELGIAAVNGPRACVASGPVPAVEALASALESRGVATRRLETSHAFHSAAMEPCLGPLTTLLRRMRLQAPRLPCVSGLTGRWLTPEEATEPTCWARQLREPVRFSEALETLWSLKEPVLLEVGPGTTLTALARRHPARPARTREVASLPLRPDTPVPCIEEAIGELWQAGLELEWSALHAARRHRVRLPPYPFEHQRYWIEPEVAPQPPAQQPAPAALVPPEQPSREPLEDWFYVPTWEQAPTPSGGGEPLAGPVLAFLDSDCAGLVEQVLATLLPAGSGVPLLRVEPAGRYEQLGEHAFRLRPESEEDWGALFQALQARGRLPRRILHAWALTSEPGPCTPAEETVLERGFLSLLRLARALGRHAPESPVQLEVLSSFAHAVGPQEPLEPLKATLLGACAVLPLEYPHLRCRNIDVRPGSEPREVLVRSLAAELAAPVEEGVVAWRNGQRYVRRTSRQRLEAPQPLSSLREQGVYLVAGGLGGIGLALARALAQRARARLALLTHAPFPPREQWEQWLEGAPPEPAWQGEAHPSERRRTQQRIRRLLELEQLGAQVQVYTADVADAAAVRSVVEQVHARWGRIHGALHAAATFEDGVIQLRTGEQSRRALRTKVQGSMVLHEVLAGEGLDWFALCSSLAAALGSLGQADYCAANAFQDAYAHHLRQQGFPGALALGWGTWRDTGAAMRLVARTRVEAEEPSPVPLTHPLFDCEQREAGGAHWIGLTLRGGGDWVVDEHRLQGVPTLPGVAYLELARAACARALGAEAVEVVELWLLEPLAVPPGESRQVRVVLQPEGQAHALRVESRPVGAQGWSEHARGRVRAVPRLAERTQPELLRAACEREEPVPGEPQEQGPVHAGPRWHGLFQWVRRGPRQALAQLTLPEAFHGDLERFQLHPALMDMATSFAIPGGVPWLAFGYERVLIHGPLPPRVLSHVSFAEEPRADAQQLRLQVRLLDLEGWERVRIDGYLLRPQRPAAASAEQAAPNLEVAVGTPGLLESLGMRRCARPAPGPHQVEIEVEAAGLNFLDVLGALGMMPALEAEESVLGRECSGRISAVGESVTGLRVGEEVLAVAPGSFRSYVLVDERQVVRRPASLGLAEGAAQLVPFATAYYSLHTVGRLRRGERILIHAAAGGLGLAAVQLASRAGAEIFATAGSEQKREYLRSLGVAHVLDSRSASFASAVRERTGGRGVEVVLNSLAGELLLAGLSVLAPHGRFLELGKRDLYADQRVGLRALARGQTFAAIDFGPHHPDFHAVLEEVAQRLAQGQLQPLPTRLFPAPQVAEAFSFMARAQHVGRVAVSMQGAAALPASTARGSRAAPAVAPPWEDPQLAGGISSEEGAEAFLRALEHKAAQLIISPQDFGALLRSLGGSQGVREKERLVTGRGAAAEPRAVQPSSLEQLVEQVWRKHLGVERVQPTDSFFQLGGDSLLGIQVVADLRRHLGLELSVATLFSHPTLAELSQALRARQGEAAAPAAPVAPAPALVPEPAARFEPFPLTDVQEAYWVGRRSAFELGGVAAHGYFEIESPGLEVERFILCWRQLLQRHDMLRMVVLADGRQQVLEQVPEYTPELVDLRGLAPQEAEARRLRLRERMAHQVLRSDRWPLFELVLCRYQGGVRIHMSMDALVLDAWSSAVLREDFARLYHEPGQPLEPLALTFRDYVLAERRLREGTAHERARAYWWARLDTLPPPPELPLVKEPSQLEHAQFTHREARLEPHRWARLQERARAHGLTPSAACMAAFAEVLARWSRSPRFTLNLTLFQRLPLHPQVDELVGDFTSLVLLEVEAHVASTFAQRASRLQAQLWRDLEHSSVSAVQLIRELVRTGRRSPGAIMPVVFTSILSLDARRGPQGSLSFFEGELVYSVSQTPQVWLDHAVHEEEGALVLTWDSVEALFPPGLVDDMFHAYQRLLEALAEEQAWEGELPELLPPAQRAQLERYNATQAPLPGGRLEDGFATQARLHPERPALLTPERTLGYGELARRAQALAARLLELEVQPQELVAIAMRKGWEQATAVLGVLQAGAAYLPLDPEQPPLRLHQLLEEGPARVVLTQSSLLHTVPWPPGVQVIAVDRLEPATEATPLPPRGAPEHLAYVIYTSGSTGKPKGVAIEHRAALNTVVDLNTRFGLGPEDRVLGLSALTFDLSVYDVLGLLAAGGALVLPAAEAEKDPAHWWERLVAERVTVWNSTPALMLLLVEYAEQRGLKLPAALRLVMLSGDWIPVALPARIRALGPGVQVVSLGGATEASIWSIAYPIGQVEPQWKSIPYGMPLANQRFHVLDERLEARPWWVPGELYIGGEGLAREYWRDEQLTAARFIRHPRTGERLYRTGDHGRMLPEGVIEFLGREDLQVKVQGFRVELGEIEAALAQHPALSASVVVARGEPRGERRLVAYVVPHSGQAPAAGELRRYLAERLPAYMVPSTFVLLESLPRSRNGKIARDQLPEPQQAQGPAAKPAAAEPLVERLAALAAQALRLERVEPQDSLLDLGADSVALIRLINRLEAELQFRPRLADLYENPTVQGLAALHQKRAESQAVRGPPQSTAPRSKLLPAEERERFKASRPGLRRFPEGTPAVALADSGSVPAAEELAAVERRRSVRTYSLAPVSREQLDRLLAPLRELEVQGSRRYLYASAGGLYPVQLYLHLKPGRVQGLEPGTWYYDPSTHRLVLLSAGAELDRRIHDPHQNRAVFDSAALSLFLIARMGAVEPVYAEHALHLATLEAGLMTQLLDQGAASSGLGLCHIGELDFARVRGLFHLEEEHVLLHSLVGGVLPAKEQEVASAPTQGGTGAQQLARLLQQVKALTPEAARALLEARRGTKGGQHE